MIKARVHNHTGTVNRIIHLYTLSCRELELLLKVNTTCNQAAKIEERNKKTLKVLQAMERDRSIVRKDLYIGCPHCYNMHCLTGRRCNWHSYPGKRLEFRCCDAFFGGIQYSDISSIRLGPDFIKIYDYGVEENELALKFLRGHVEWAQVVQMIGGVKNQKWYVEDLEMV